MDNSGYQALHLAAGHYEDVSVIRSFIVEYPAALHVKSDSGKTPLQYAQSTGTQRPTHPEIVSLIDCCTCANNEYEIKKLCGAIDPTYAHLRDQLEAAMKARDCDRIDESIALMESIRLGADDLVVQARALAEELRPLQAMSKLERQLSDRNRKLDEATEKVRDGGREGQGRPWRPNPYTNRSRRAPLTPPPTPPPPPSFSYRGAARRHHLRGVHAGTEELRHHALRAPRHLHGMLEQAHVVPDMQGGDREEDQHPRMSGEWPFLFS